MLKTKTKNQELEHSFYSERFKFSYSGLNTLLVNPALFYNDYVLKKKESSIAKFLLEGTLIHFLILENQGFDDNFIITPGSLPAPNNMMIAEKIFKIYEEEPEGSIRQNLSDFNTEILQILIDINLHQNLKDTKDGLGDDKRIKKVCDVKTEDYFNFLKERQGRTIIDSEMLAKCTERADKVKDDKEMRRLLGMDLSNDGVKNAVYNELYVHSEMPNLPFDFHGTIDNMVVDTENKTVRINDLKTTSKNLKDFEKSVEIWNYWLQAVMYRQLAKHYLKDHIDSNWKIEFRFIVFDKYDQMYPFLVSEKTMLEWGNDANLAIHKAIYHYNNKEYNLPYEFATGKVVL